MRLKSLIVKFLYIPKYLLIYLIGHPVNPIRDIVSKKLILLTILRELSFLILISKK